MNVLRQTTCIGFNPFKVDSLLPSLIAWQWVLLHTKWRFLTQSFSEDWRPTVTVYCQGHRVHRLAVYCQDHRVHCFCCSGFRLPLSLILYFIAFFGSIVYNRAIVYKRQNFFMVIVIKIITDQCNQTARVLHEIQVTVIYSRAILVAVTSECY